MFHPTLEQLEAIMADEKYLLYEILVNPDFRPWISQGLLSENFMVREHRVLYAVIADMFRAEMPINLLSVYEQCDPVDFGGENGLWGLFSSLADELSILADFDEVGVEREPIVDCLQRVMAYAEVFHYTLKDRVVWRRQPLKRLSTEDVIEYLYGADPESPESFLDQVFPT